MSTQESIVREPLLKTMLESLNVQSVDVRSIQFAPGQATGLHRHPCHVFGYIAEGSVLFEVEGQEPVTLKAGSAFYEPAGATIFHFDNASTTEPLHFITFYLLSGDEPLIEMLRPSA